MKVCVAGEGANELGGWATEIHYRAARPDPGVIETLARRKRSHGWTVGHSVRWKDIRHYVAGSALRGEPETRNVRRAALMAKEQGCDVLLFLRDRDRAEERQRAIEDALRAPLAVPTAGGIPQETLDNWMAALLGKADAETLGKAGLAEFFQSAGVTMKQTAEYVRICEEADLGQQSVEQCQSLQTWLQRVEAVLGAQAP